VFLIGSRALACLNFWRPAKDWDIVLEGCEDKPEQLPKGVEIIASDFEDLNANTLVVCAQYCAGWKTETPLGEAWVVAPEGIMLLKRSHLHRERNFEKHIRDYHFLLERYRCDTEIYRGLLGARIRLIRAHFGDKTPSLAQLKKDFFDDGVEKIYEHDDIHRAVAYYTRPLFEMLHEDGQEVLCSRAKWDTFSHGNKISCVREEAFTIAIERRLLHRRGMSPRHAFDWALMRICTTLTSGFFRDFAIDNWPEIREYGEYDFWRKFRDNEPERIKSIRSCSVTEITLLLPSATTPSRPSKITAAKVWETMRIVSSLSKKRACSKGITVLWDPTTRMMERIFTNPMTSSPSNAGW
jgi:hypothetical protein